MIYKIQIHNTQNCGSLQFHFCAYEISWGWHYLQWQMYSTSHCWGTLEHKNMQVHRVIVWVCGSLFINVPLDESAGLSRMLKRGSSRLLASISFTRYYTAPWRTHTVRQHDWQGLCQQSRHNTENALYHSTKVKLNFGQWLKRVTKHYRLPSIGTINIVKFKRLDYYL